MVLIFNLAQLHKLDIDIHCVEIDSLRCGYARKLREVMQLNYTITVGCGLSFNANDLGHVYIHVHTCGVQYSKDPVLFLELHNHRQ